MSRLTGLFILFLAYLRNDYVIKRFADYRNYRIKLSLTLALASWSLFLKICVANEQLLVLFLGKIFGFQYGFAACCEEWLCLSVKLDLSLGLRPYPRNV